MGAEAAPHVDLRDPGPVADGDAQRRLRTVLATGQELVWECDTGGVVTFVSPNVTDFLGYAPEEVIGHRASRFLHPASRQVYCDRVAAILAGRIGGWWHEQACWIARDGTEVCLDGTAVAYVDDAGHVVGFGGTSRHPDAGVLTRQRREVVRSRVLRMLMRGDLDIVFQPIVDLTTGAVLGVEALSRFPRADGPDSPDKWFADATEVGLGVELEILAVREALAVAADTLPATMYLSVNVSPATLTSDDLHDVIATSSLPPDRLVVEVTEHASVADYESMMTSVAELRARGLRLAVDDAGAGYASFRHILRMAPECIKLDRDVIAGIDGDAARRAFAAAAVMFALETGAMVVAEGIETRGELRTVQLLGIDSGQGYLLGRPAADLRLSTKCSHLSRLAGVGRKPGAVAG